MTLKDNGDESVLQEAQRLTHGDRNKDYGHPLDDYTRTAALINALLSHKLKEPLDAEDAAQIQILVKLSRHQTVRKRDNMTDAAGYAWVSWACTEERERRANPQPDFLGRTIQPISAPLPDELQALLPEGRRPHELDAQGNCPECLELSKLPREDKRCPGCGVMEDLAHYPNCPRLDPHTYCEVNLERLVPVIGCECSACSRKRRAAIGV